MMGSQKPIAEFVVAPSRVATVPKLVRPNDIRAQPAQIIQVYIIFWFFSSLPLPKTSSIESFIGKTQNGEANVTTINIPKRQI